MEGSFNATVWKWLYSDEMMLAKVPKMLVDDGTMDSSTSSFEDFQKNSSEELSVFERK